MNKLGISIYPDIDNSNRVVEYLELAAKYKFSRIFECLLLLEEKTREEIVKEFRPMNEIAKKLGYEIIVDINPIIFKKVGVTPFDLSFFNELGVDGFRLDTGYTGFEESIMSCNPHGLLIELNPCWSFSCIDTVIDFQPVRSNLIACPNFFPQRHTGLSINHYKKTSSKFIDLGLRLAAFVTSQVKGSFGPFDPGVVPSDGQPTLECHRDIPIECQTTHLLAIGGIQDIIISNCYPSETELKNMSDVFGIVPTFDVILDKRTSQTERDILFDEIHIRRGDISDIFIRSTSIPEGYIPGYSKRDVSNISLFNVPKTIRRGDVTINSNKCGSRYAGEMHIALCDFPNTGKSNVVGKIRAEEVLAIDEVKPWQKFKLRLYKEK